MMTQEQKELLLKDLCARLPYGVKAHIEHDTFYDEVEPYDGMVNTNTINDLLRNEKLEVRPYLRSMSNMTDEEQEHCGDFILHGEDWMSYYDYLDSKLLDYRGLIDKGLALEAPEDMYKNF